MTNKKTTAAPLPLWQYWRGLGGWNFYFLVKFALLWAGYLNFHPMLNLVFLAFLLVPIPRDTNSIRPRSSSSCSTIRR